MGKKKNLHADVDPQKLHKEVSSILQYLEFLDVANIYDDIYWMSKPKPMVISTIEKKILTALRVIQQCANIAIAMYEKEGISDSLNHMVFTTVNCMKEIQQFYDTKPVAHIEHRFVEGITNDAKGNPRPSRVLANSKEDQIVARITITEKILAILPLIEKLETVNTNSQLRGDKETPESMLYNN